MSYKEFEEIPVWRDAVTLSAMVFKLTDRPIFRNKGDVANQIQRAALSVSNNIAEGFERGSTTELIAFLYYARGSAGEVRSICYVMLKLGSLTDFELQITEIQQLAKSIGRQLGGWLKTLKNVEDEMPGQRHFTESDRIRKDDGKRADAFMAKLKQATQENIQRSRGGIHESK